MSTKRNRDLVIARTLGWRQFIFLDDDSFDAAAQ